MTNGYMKVVATGTMRTRLVEDLDAEPEEGGSGQRARSVAVPGFIKWQQFWFFDVRDPASVRAAFEAAQAFAMERKGKLSMYGQPPFGGPWDVVQRVGAGIGTGALPEPS
jgi:hypothetical protein